MKKYLIILLAITAIIAASACIDNDTPVVPETPDVPEIPSTTNIAPIAEMELTQLIPQDALPGSFSLLALAEESTQGMNATEEALKLISGNATIGTCLLYTSPSPRD